MKRLVGILFIVLLAVWGCSGGEQEKSRSSAGESAAPPVTQAAPFKSVPPAEAAQLIHNNKNLVLIDVRTPEELREGAIEGSTMVPFWAVMQNKLTIPKDTPIMLICAVGGRSYAAGQMLVKYGYTDIYNLSGGISAWKQAGLPLKY